MWSSKVWFTLVCIKFHTILLFICISKVATTIIILIWIITDFNINSISKCWSIIWIMFNSLIIILLLNMFSLMSHWKHKRFIIYFIFTISWRCPWNACISTKCFFVFTFNDRNCWAFVVTHAVEIRCFKSISGSTI